MANTKSARRTVIVWVLVIITAFLIGYYVLPAITRSAYGVTADDMTREQQVVLMQRCYNDAYGIWRGRGDREMAAMIRLFWEYRTREQ